MSDNTNTNTVPTSFIDNPNVVEGGKIYNVTDYSIFEHLVGNRTLVQENVRKIEKSILEKGYASGSLVTINDKGEIIDGQHRVQAVINIVRKTGKKIPIPVLVLGGATIQDVMLINQNRKNWGPSEFDESYAAQGNKDYIFLQGMKKQYSDKLGLGEEIVVKVILHECGLTKKDRIEGNLVIPNDKMIRIHNILKYMSRFVEYVKEIKDKNHCHTYSSWNFFNALLFCAFYSGKKVDLEHLLDSIKKVANSADPPRIDGYTEGNVKFIDDAYNAHRMSSKQIPFRAIFIGVKGKF